MFFGSCILSLMDTTFPSFQQASCLVFHLFVHYCIACVLFFLMCHIFLVKDLCSLYFDYTSEHFKKIAHILSLIVPYIIPAFSIGNIYFKQSFHNDFALSSF